MKKDDHTICEKTQKDIRKRADLLLRKADALGTFPTPIPKIVEAAGLELSREAILDKVFIGDFYRNLPNALKLAPDKIKKAAAKLMGLLDRHDRTIHIDKELYPAKQSFLTLHEVGHDFLPWQSKTFSLLEDSETELDPDTRDSFEREANCFASDVMFQNDAFTKEVADHSFTIWTPVKIGKNYGASVYAALRRYVSTSEISCAVVVLEQVKNSRAALRRVIVSPQHLKNFGNYPLPFDFGPGDFFYESLPAKRYSKTSLLTLKDLNGDEWGTSVECFNSSKNYFYLIRPTRKCSVTVGGLIW